MAFGLGFRVLWPGAGPGRIVSAEMVERILGRLERGEPWRRAGACAWLGWGGVWAGCPSEEFLVSVDPLLAGVRAMLGGRSRDSGCLAGGLSPEWASRLGLLPGIPVPVGALDAHWDAVGAGCLVNVIGTSSCIMALSERCDPMLGIPAAFAERDRAD